MGTTPPREVYRLPDEDDAAYQARAAAIHQGIADGTLCPQCGRGICVGCSKDEPAPNPADALMAANTAKYNTEVAHQDAAVERIYDSHEALRAAHAQAAFREELARNGNQRLRELLLATRQDRDTCLEEMARQVDRQAILARQAERERDAAQTRATALAAALEYIWRAMDAGRVVASALSAPLIAKDRQALGQGFDIDAPPCGQCNRCGRLTWTPVVLGHECLMVQPNGSRCAGTFVVLAHPPRPTRRAAAQGTMMCRWCGRGLPTRADPNPFCWPLCQDRWMGYALVLGGVMLTTLRRQPPPDAAAREEA